MSEFLGVPYWDVVLRGFALAFVYYVSLRSPSISCACGCCRATPIEAPPVPLYDQIKTAIFFSRSSSCSILMGCARHAASCWRALYTAAFMFVAPASLLFLYFKYVRKDPAVAQGVALGNIRITIETHAEMTSYLTLLLATLGIMIGLFTVTGFINRMGGDAARARRVEHHRA